MEVTEFTDEDAAEVGWALIKAIEAHAYPGWSPAQCPSEIVGDLRNECDELSSELKKTEAIRVELERQKAYAYGLTDRIHDLQSLLYQYKHDADRYRMLRDEDAWGEDTADSGCSAWQILGELSGKSFDDFVDARFMKRANAGDCFENELPPPGHPLNVLATRLGELLDEDHWAECEALILKACMARAKERAELLSEIEKMKVGGK